MKPPGESTPPAHGPASATAAENHRETSDSNNDAKTSNQGRLPLPRPSRRLQVVWEGNRSLTVAAPIRAATVRGGCCKPVLTAHPLS